jgi:ribosomal subunit interface protein
VTAVVRRGPVPAATYFSPQIQEIFFAWLFLRFSNRSLNSAKPKSDKYSMQMNFKYRHLLPNPKLTQYATEHAEKLLKFETKSMKVDFTFSHEKSENRVDIHIRGRDLEVHAHAMSQDFFHALDEALEKAERQLGRNKERKQGRPTTTHKTPHTKAS